MIINLLKIVINWKVNLLFSLIVTIFFSTQLIMRTIRQGGLKKVVLKTHNLIVRVYCLSLQGLCVCGARPHNTQAHVPRVPLRHPGTHHRQHAAWHLQENHDRAQSPAELGQTHRYQWVQTWAEQGYGSALADFKKMFCYNDRVMLS